MPTSARDRAYSAPPNLSALGMGYGWSSTYVNTSGNAGCPVTGAWLPANISTGGNLQVELTNVNVSFTGSLSVNTAALELITTSGVKFQAASSGFLSTVVSELASGVPTYSVAAGAASNFVPSGASLFGGSTIITGQALAANGARASFFIANNSTVGPLYVKLGAGTVSTGLFSFILNPATTAGYQGGAYSDDKYKGIVSVSGYNFNVWEY